MPNSELRAIIHSMLNAITSFITKHSLISPNDTIIVGLSGGPDSVFLLHYLKSMQEPYNLRLITAHLDHQWRSHSGDDAEFCKKLAQELSVEFVDMKASELNQTFKYNGSQEDMGRKMRRYFFEKVRIEYNATSIALAHHAQDQQETFFIRLLRGSSLSGLTGIKPKDSYYIRPLLSINKQDILSYLQDNNINYVIDPTNTDNSYLRNRIRNQVIPALNCADNRFDHNFEKTVQQLQMTEEYLQKVTRETFERIACRKDDSWHLDLVHFIQLDPFIQDRILLYWLIQERVPFSPSMGLLQEIKRFLHNKKSSTHIIYATWMLQKNLQKVSISRC